MPEYGQPIYNNLHWKSTLDFFKEKEDEPEEGSLEEARAQDRKIIEQERAAVLANVSGAKSYEPKSEDAQFHDTGRTAPVDPKTGKVSQADLKAPAYEISPDENEEKIHDELKNNIDKDNGGEGAFDESVPMPKPKVTSKDHPEGPGVPLKNGFTEKEKRELARDDRRLSSPSYPQDPDANPEYTSQPGVRKPYVRPSRAGQGKKKPIEESLLKLMKAHEKPIFRGATRTAGQRGPFDSEEPMTFRPMPNAQGNIPLLPEEIAGDRGSSPTAGERAETTLGRRPTAMPPEMVDAARKVSARQLAYEASPEGLREDPRMRSRPPGVEPHPEEVSFYDKRKIARAAQERAAKEADPSLYNKESSVEKSLLKLMKDGSIDKDDDDMGAKKPGIKQPPSSPKNRPYGNPSPPPVQPKEKSIDKARTEPEWEPMPEVPGKDEALELPGGKAAGVISSAEGGHSGNPIADKLKWTHPKTGEAKEGLFGSKAELPLTSYVRGPLSGQDEEEWKQPSTTPQTPESREQSRADLMGVVDAMRYDRDVASDPRHRALRNSSSVEKSLLKLMKDEDEQELNPMEDPPKENEESQALVADGDSKRPKSEVGTNDKMFKKEHERTPEEEKEVYVQRQINRRNAPGEHPEMSDTQRLIAQILQQKEEDAKQKATRLAPPGTVYSSRGGEHGDEDYDGPIEKALLKLMKGGEISPAKVGMPRRAAIEPIENAFPVQAPKAPKGVGVSTASAPPPRSALETETSRPDSDQAGQTANWSAQMFAGDLAGKINRRFGTGKQDAIDAQRQAWETQIASQEKYPDLARQAENTRNKPYGDTTSQGFGDSGVQQQQEFQRQTGIMGNQGRPVPSSLLSSTKK